MVRNFFRNVAPTYIVGHLGSISPTFYEQLLRPQIPKVQKTQKTWLSFCAFWICAHKSCTLTCEINPSIQKIRLAEKLVHIKSLHSLAKITIRLHFYRCLIDNEFLNCFQNKVDIHVKLNFWNTYINLFITLCFTIKII